MESDAQISVANQCDDWELLRLYREQRSQAAFAELVTRHIDLVHTAAVRQVRDSHKAQDVTQVVFMVLARKAGKIERQVVLPGWLVRTTHFVSKSLIKSEARRARHEKSAAEAAERTAAMGTPNLEPPTYVHQSGCGMGEPGVDEAWHLVSPCVDAALARLPSSARDVLVLRFFGGQSYRAIGERLGLTEEAARKRGERGIRSLRSQFEKRGILTTAHALETMLASTMVLPVPFSVKQAVTAGVGVAQNQVTILKGALTLMAWSRAKIVLTATAAALVIGGTGVLTYQVLTPPRDEVVKLNKSKEPDSTLQTQSTEVISAGPYVIKGKVKALDGSPVPDATVLVSFGDGRFLQLKSDGAGRIEKPEQQTSTGADGQFEIRVEKRPVGVVVLGKSGALNVSSDALTHNENIVLKDYARIAGKLALDGKPVQPGSDVLITCAHFINHAANLQLFGRTDADGRFVIERIPRGKYDMFANGESGEIWLDGGTDAVVNINRPPGRDIVGTLKGVNRRERVLFQFTLAGASTMWATKPGIFVVKTRNFDSYVEPDGNFRIKNVAPGGYSVGVSLMNGQWGFRHADPKVKVPELGEEDQAGPVQVGVWTLKTAQ